MLAEDEVARTWQWDVCRWLVAPAAATLLAWGKECEAWTEAVDEAAAGSGRLREVGPSARCSATAFEDEDIEEVFWFARHRAAHPAGQPQGHR